MVHRSMYSVRNIYIWIAFIPVVVGIVGLIALFHAPYTGISFTQRDGRWFIEDVDGPSAGLEAFKGKEVYSIAGFRVEEFDLVEDFDYIPTRDGLNHWWRAQRYFSENVKTGLPLTITIRDGESFRDVVIIPSSIPLHRLIASNFTIMSVIAVFTLFVSLVVVFKRPGDIRAGVFFLFAFLVSLMDFTFGSYTSRDIAFDFRVFTLFRIINGIAYTLFPVSFLHFCLIFPYIKGIARNRFFLPFLYLLSVVLAIFFQTRVSYLSLNLLFLGCLLGGIVSMYHTYIVIDSPTERAQVRWVILGTSVFAAVFLITAYIPILFKGYRIAGDMVPTFFFPLIPLSIAFAIERYRLMDIDTLFDGALIYTITLGVLVLIDIWVISLFTRLREGFVRIEEPIPMIIAVWVVILTYVPIRETVRKLVKRLLRRDEYDMDKETLSLSNRLLSSEDIPSILDGLMDAIERTLSPVGAGVFLFDEKGDGVLVTEDSITDDVTRRVVSAALEIETPVLLYTFIPLDELPVEYKGGVLVPLRRGDGISGFLVLGNKHSGKLYDGRDMKLLRVFSYQTALAIENVKLRERAVSKEKEMIDEKERISMDIHDGVVTELAGIMAYSEKGEMLLHRDVDEESLKDIFTRIGEFSRRGLKEIKNIVWAIRSDVTPSDLMAYIKRYCSDLMDGYGIRFSFIHEGISGVNIPPDKRLALLRVVQEACQNTGIHSDARNAGVTFSFRHDLLEVEIWDDGKGFDKDRVIYGSGLKNMKKRIMDAGGSIDVLSSQGKGTRLKVALPI